MNQNTDDRRLFQMLKNKPFDRLLTDGDLYDVNGAAQRAGYSPQHVRRLCHEDRIPHIRRAPEGAEQVQFYFLPEHLAALFSFHKPRGEA